MLHMSSTHQMQRIHPDDLTLICPYVGVLGVGVWCSLSKTGSQQAKKKPNLSTVTANFRKNMVPDPPPNPNISEKPYSRAFQIYPTYPYLWDTQWTQMRQQWHRPSKNHKVGRFPNVPERYVTHCFPVQHSFVFEMSQYLSRLGSVPDPSADTHSHYHSRPTLTHELEEATYDSDDLSLGSIVEWAGKRQPPPPAW